MKKRNNKIIILAIVGIIFTVLLGIFILNYSKDDYSFSILEKKWINDNTSNILDVSIYNDVPIYGQSGEGIIFSYLVSFMSEELFVCSVSEIFALTLLSFEPALPQHLIYSNSYGVREIKTAERFSHWQSYTAVKIG